MIYGRVTVLSVLPVYQVVRIAYLAPDKRNDSDLLIYKQKRIKQLPSHFVPSNFGSNLVRFNDFQAYLQRTK